jgi:hypothetical protein
VLTVNVSLTLNDPSNPEWDQLNKAGGPEFQPHLGDFVSMIPDDSEPDDTRVSDGAWPSAVVANRSWDATLDILEIGLELEVESAKHAKAVTDWLLGLGWFRYSDDAAEQTED